MKIKYAEFGSGEKTMLILPGLSIRTLSDNVAPIAQAYKMFAQDYTVYLFDMPEVVEDGYDLPDMANDFFDKIRELGLKDIYLFGVSIGGMAAQILSLDHPQLIKKLCLCSTVSYLEEKNAVSSWKKLAEEGDSTGLLEQMIRYIYGEDNYDAYIGPIKALYSDLSQEELQRFAKLCSAADGFDVRQRLPQLKMPVYCLGSRKDMIFPYEQQKVTADILACDSFYYDAYCHAVYDEAADIKEKIYDFFEGE